MKPLLLNYENGLRFVHSGTSSTAIRYTCCVASGRRDPTGSLVGLAVFLAGVAILVVTFSIAYQQFGVPQAKALGLEKGKEIDFAVTGGSFANIVIRLGYLLVMAIIGSLLANKGIGLYSGALHPVEKHIVPGSRQEIDVQDVDVEEVPSS